MNAPKPTTACDVTAPLAYLAATHDAIEHRIFPPNSGRATVRPPVVYQTMPIRDARHLAQPPELDTYGFALCADPVDFDAFYDDGSVRANYYPLVAAFLRAKLAAAEVCVFDHNQRSAVRAGRGDPGVRMPVDAVHNDYTERSAPRRAREILEATGRLDLEGRRFAFINVWRPIVGPVNDAPLAVCDARSVASADIVDTPIHHFGEDDLEHPRHTGQIQSILHNAAHRWYYYPAMQPSEVLLLKCYDSARDGRARFMPHTGFSNPACPPQFVPRESIEVRTLVVY